nr:immunoglobulin heavy chain junction region [Macaca mulatta]MOY29410.1 immunoglobulin heavy chain junction region [Macaca mulatta]MOY30213.1 immunoglobulin heavy chain junction region [Macaca mulatta]
CVRKQANFDYW